MRLTTIHTGKGNLGFSEAVFDGRVWKSHPILKFFNQAMLLKTELNVLNPLIESPIDKGFIQEVLIDKWVQGLNGSAYFKFTKMGVPSNISDWLEKRIGELQHDCPNFMEFVNMTTFEGWTAESVTVRARSLELAFWDSVEEIAKHDYDLTTPEISSNLRVLNDPELDFGGKPSCLDFLKAVSLNGRFLNLLGDYLFLCSVYVEKGNAKYWENPNLNKQAINNCQDILEKLDQLKFPESPKM